MKNDVAKRVERTKLKDVKYRDSPDIVVKVVCKYRAELYFKVSRKAKFSRLFHAWSDRMDAAMTMGAGLGATNATTVGSTGKGGRRLSSTDGLNGIVKPDLSKGGSDTQFIFSHGGRTLEPDQAPEEVGMEAGDEILAVELMDLTVGPGTEVVVGDILFFSIFPSLFYTHRAGTIPIRPLTPTREPGRRCARAQTGETGQKLDRRSQRVLPHGPESISLD